MLSGFVAVFRAIASPGQAAGAAALALVAAMSPLIVVAAPVATPKFEVASIKLNNSGRAGWDGFKISHGNFNVVNASLEMLITGRSTSRSPVSGGPAWLSA